MSDELNFQPSGISDKLYATALKNMMTLARHPGPDCEDLLKSMAESLSLKRCLLVYMEPGTESPLRHFEHTDTQVPLEFSVALEQELISVFAGLDIFEDVEVECAPELMTTLAEGTGFDLCSYSTKAVGLFRTEYRSGDCFGFLIAVRDFGQEFSPAENQLVEVTGHLLQSSLDAKYWRDLFNHNNPRDRLTGLMSRKEILKFCQWECQRLQNTTLAPRVLAVIGLDIDNVRWSNDQYGLTFTDEVLQTLSSCVQESVLPGQLAARYGGDEFIILLPDSEQREAESFAENLRSKIAALQVPDGLAAGRVCTASFGIALAPKHASTAEELFERVTSAIDLAKSKGKNCVVTLP